MYSFLTDESVFANIGLQKNRVILYDVTDSTNTRAREAFISSGNDAPRLYVTEEQTAGRGTRGRSFESGRGGLYFSILYVPETDDYDPTGLTAIAAAAVFDALTDLLGEEKSKSVLIKWVNDIYIAGKKAVGILTERVSGNEKVGYVVGIGINVLKQKFSADVSKIATSIEDAAGEALDKGTLLLEILKRLLPSLPSPKTSRLAQIYRQNTLRNIAEITVTDSSTATRAAEPLGIDEEFRLTVRYENGEIDSLVSADVGIKINQF